MKVFLSHASRDKPLLREVCANLPSHVDVWLDERKIRAGQHLEGALYAAIRREVDVFVLFVGPEAVRSEWVRKELDWALERERELGRLFLLPVVLDEGSTSHLSEVVRNRRYLPCSDFSVHGVRAFSSHLSDELFAYASFDRIGPLGLEWEIASQDTERVRLRSRRLVGEIVRDGSNSTAIQEILSEVIGALEPLDRLRVLVNHHLMYRAPEDAPLTSRPDHVLVECSTAEGRVLRQRLDFSDRAHGILRHEFGLGNESDLIQTALLEVLDQLGGAGRKRLFSGLDLLRVTFER